MPRPRLPKVAPHGSKRKGCKLCSVPHTKNQHRFHGDNSMKKTHKKYRQKMARRNRR